MTSNTYLGEPAFASSSNQPDPMASGFSGQVAQPLFNASQSFYSNHKYVGQIGARIGFAIGVIAEPFSSLLDGASSLWNAANAALLSRKVDQAQFEELTNRANTQLASFERTLSNTYAAGLKTLNPSAEIIDTGHDGVFTALNNALFDAAVAKVGNNRLLLVAKFVGQVVGRVLDLVVGLIAAVVSIPLLGRVKVLNTFAYTHLKIGAIFTDIIRLCRGLVDPKAELRSDDIAYGNVTDQTVGERLFSEPSDNPF